MRTKYSRFIVSLALLVACAFALHGQTNIAEPSTAALDSHTKTLATQLAAAIATARGGNNQVKVAVGNFVYEGSVPPLGALWSNNLASSLVDTGNRAFTVLAEPATQDFIIQGEIISLGDALRLYTRLVRSSDNSIVFSRHHDITANEFIAGLLNSGRSPSLPADSLEPNNSRETAAMLDVASGGLSVDLNFHNDSDTDWFKFTLPAGSRIVRISTAGDMDTLIELYNQSGDKITEDDDEGEDYNAKVQHTLDSGEYYLRVGNYDSSSGYYTLNITFVDPPRPDMYEVDNETLQAKTIAVNNTPQQRSLHDDTDIDWIRLDISRSGTYRISAQPPAQSSLDTYIELYNTQMSMIGSDDDGGDNLGALLEQQLQPGTYYIKVYAISEISDDGSYALSVSTP